MPADTALHKAAHYGDLNQVKEIVERGEIELDAPGAADRRPLHRAAGSNQIEVCKYLISQGASITQKDKSGRTPLYYACTNGHKPSAEILIAAGADIFEITSSKMLPLHISAENGQPDVVELLVNTAGDKRQQLFAAKNEENKTPAELALDGKHKDVVKILKASGDPHAKSAGSCIIM